jgi:N6-L-threonylcarbamoyladenine synthase
MIVLGIETSCDETACSIVNSNKEILSNQLYSQVKLHQKFGGVVPEIASRAHVKIIEEIVQKAIFQAKIDLSKIDAIACTSGPGLIGGLMVGVMVGKAMASCLNKPFLAINHLEGHALSSRLTGDLPYPFMLLLVSGGHSQIILAKEYGHYKLLGESLDDALGETFDKLAKLLSLPYPGGPEIEKLALKGDENSIKLPMPLYKDAKNATNFSFSGLKTHLSLLIQKSELTDTFKANLCASFQKLVLEFIFSRVENSLENHKIKNLVIAGGVASNEYLRKNLEVKLKTIGLNLVFPPKHICTDNAAMIAWAGIEKLQNNPQANDIDFEPRARWAL